MADRYNSSDNRPKSSGGIRRPGMSSGNTGVSRRESTHSSLPESYDNGVRRQSRAETLRTSAPAASSSSVSPARQTAKKSSVSAEKSSPSRFHKDVKEERKNVGLIVIIILLLIGIVFFFSYLSYTYMIDSINNPVTEDSIVLDNATELKFRVEKKDTTRSISQRLYDLGLIRNKTIYRFLSKFNGYDGRYKAGTYTLSKKLSYEEIMVILSGTPETVKVTFPEGFTTLQIAARLEANNVCTKEAFLKAVNTVDISSYAFLQGVDLSTRDYRLDGYLFPDTYEFDVLAQPEDIIYKMLNRFNTVFKPAYYNRLEELHLSMDQAVILASLVEREAKLDSDRAPIAGVFMNRYKSSDSSLKKFQSCATLRYVYKKLFDVDLINITAENEAVEDPYNTYLHEGFTPGPICSPGLASLEAALYPENHSYYYFVAKTDGSGGHIFSCTYAEHLAAKKSQAS